MAHIVTCIYCKKKFDRDKIPFTQLSERRYAHIGCAATAQAEQEKREQAKQKLTEYIKQLFGLESLTVKINRQIKEYAEEYNYSYSGIYHTLVYWYEIKKNDISKANGGIGIVPYVYQQALEYYKALWIASDKNKDKKFEQYIPQVREVHIIAPKRNIYTRKKFTFLDEEVEDEQ